MLKSAIESTLRDLSPMPFGKYRGVAMQDVPAEYLHWIWHNVTPVAGQDSEKVHRYIEASLEALKEENNDLLWSKD